MESNINTAELKWNKSLRSFTKSELEIVAAELKEKLEKLPEGLESSQVEMEQDVLREAYAELKGA